MVARDPDDRFYSFTIDRGSLSGIEPLDPVVTADGLVGVVREVGVNYSKVVTILDVWIDVGARDVRTRDIGIVTGSVDLAADGKCRLNYLPRESGAAPGDIVVTSGHRGQPLPAGAADRQDHPHRQRAGRHLPLRGDRAVRRRPPPD